VELKQAPHPVAQAWQEVVMTLRKYQPARHLTHMGLELALVCVQVPQF